MEGVVALGFGTLAAPDHSWFGLGASLWAARIFSGYMPIKISRIVKDPKYLDRVLAVAPVDYEMPGPPDGAHCVHYASAAKEQVVSPDTPSQILPLG